MTLYSNLNIQTITKLHHTQICHNTHQNVDKTEQQGRDISRPVEVKLETLEG